MDSLGDVFLKGLAVILGLICFFVGLTTAKLILIFITLAWLFVAALIDVETIF